jgi:hypothetical protein
MTTNARDRLFQAFLATCAAALLTGCETEPAGESFLTIIPESAVVGPGESVEFIATGGDNYHWSIESGKESWGILSERSGDRTVYTSRYLPPKTGGDILLVLTVTSTVPGSGTTNAPAFSQTAEAYITHVRVDGG